MAIDTPFDGCLIPMAFYETEPRVHGIMIELNRKLYMNEATGEKHSGFEKLQVDLLELRNAL